MLTNIITVNFPQGCGGHIAGRILASSPDIAWYNHRQNGDNPWNPYTVDPKFSRLHFTRRFKEDSNTGGVPPVLDLAEKRNMDYHRESIEPWLKKYYPKKLLYTLHADLPRTREFFKSEKHLVIIPKDINILVDQWMNSSYHYFVSADDKDFTYGDLYYQYSIERNKSIRECIKEDLTLQVDQYKRDIIETDIVIHEVAVLYDNLVCEEIMNKLGLSFNMERYLRVLELVDEHTHL